MSYQFTSLKHVGKSCYAFAISRLFINDPGIVNKWIDNPDHLTSYLSCNKFLQGEGIVVCRKED